MNSISANLNVMLKAAERASKVLIRDFGELEKLQVSNKGQRDFVTNSDLKVKNIIIEELSKARPKYSFLSEETGFRKNKDINNVWIVSPIDGNINFLHGIPHFAISISIQCDGEIISGLIFDPIKNELFYADKNNGAFLNNQRIRVSKRNEIQNCLLATNENLEKKIEIISRKTGCPSLDMAYVASGRFDCFFQTKMNLCDVAAGILLIKEAGGMIDEINIKNYKNMTIFASTPSINSKLSKVFMN